jgi:hypothetical protein
MQGREKKKGGGHTGFWYENFKTDLIEKIGAHGLDLSVSGWRPMAASCEHSNELSGSIKCWEFLVWQSFSGRTQLSVVGRLVSQSVSQSVSHYVNIFMLLVLSSSKYSFSSVPSSQTS